MGFGASVLSTLIKTKIKKNLYFEIKDRVFEERFDGVRTIKKTQKQRVYGFDETKSSRELLMEILRDRMENYKSKFISPIIYGELTTLETKKNGRIEHSDNAHDDQIFSYLMALYVWYEGKNLMETFGLEKSTIHTDNNLEDVIGLEEEYNNISDALDTVENEEVQQQIQYLNSNRAIQYRDWERSQIDSDQQALKVLMRNKEYRKAYAEKNHTNEEELAEQYAWTELPASVFMIDGIDMSEDNRSALQREFDSITDLR